MAKKAGPAKKKVMKKGGMAKKAGPMKGMAMGGRGSMDTGSRSGGLRVAPRGMKMPPQPKIDIDPAIMAQTRQSFGRKPMAMGGRSSMDTGRRGVRQGLPRGMKMPPRPKIDPALIAQAKQGFGRTSMATGGTAKSATSVKMNRGAPKVRTVKARGRGAATKGTQFRENT